MALDPFALIWKSLPLFFRGVAVTVQLFICASALGIFLGIGFGILISKKMKRPLLSKMIGGVTFIVRAIPFFVQLLIAYFVVPDLLEINLSPFTASVVALGICSSGYVAQFIRGGLDGIPISHWEAALTLGYTRTQTLVKVIFPQAFRLALPALNNELEALLKSTAIVSSIGMLELTRIGMNVVSREMEPVPIYLAIACLYMCLSIVLNLITKRIEKKVSYVNY
ncbi:MAG: amino acid ABC transporter permease [Chlamydiia bacterium]|nr:amino acid ABC transporter permease [Chlamydiia bacterium]